MQEKIQWNLYAELEAEVVALLEVVQETLASFSITPAKPEGEAA